MFHFYFVVLFSKISKQKNIKDQVKQLREKLSKKRRGEEKPEKEMIFLSVQLVSQDPQGTFQKYKRIGALKSVQIESNPTLESIREACIKHYKKYNKKCDLLVTERGPSVIHISQLNLKKVIHVRFIGDVDTDSDSAGSIEEMLLTSRKEIFAENKA